MKKETVTKKMIAIEIAEQTEITQQTGMEITNIVLNYLRNKLVEGSRIELHDLGIFEPITKKERVARNIRTGEKVIVPEKKGIKYKPAKKLLEEMNPDLY